MAASGRISVSVTGQYGNISGYIVWSESDVNTSANTSKVTATLYYSNKSGATTYSSTASPAFYLTINGNTKSTSSGITVSAYSSGVAAITHSVIVSHNDNGSKSITISGGGGLSGTSDFQNSYGSGTATLTSIVRGKPTAEMTISHYSTNEVVNGWGVYVKGISQVNYSIVGTPYGGSGASIVAYEFYGNGQTIIGSSGRTNPVVVAGTITLKGFVKDSRGIWSDASTKVINAYDYANPKINSANAFRSDENGVKSASGTHITILCNAEVGASVGGRNSVSSITYTVKDNDSGTQIYSGTLSSGIEKILSEAKNEKSYLVTVVVTDTVGTTTTRTVVVPKSVVTLHLAENGLAVAVGTTAEQENAFVINPNWDFYAGNSVSDYILQRGTGGIWTYEKWKSGIAKVWAREQLTNEPVETAKGSCYSSDLLSYNYPFPIYDAVCFGSAGYGATSSHFPWISNVVPLEGRIEFYIECASSVTFPSLIVSLCVIGRWK